MINNKESYKSFKSREDLTSFFKQIHKRTVEQVLNAELDTHLDKEKHDKTKDGNYRNGHYNNKIKSSFGEAEIKAFTRDMKLIYTAPTKETAKAELRDFVKK